ncbi:MAG: MFS transporter, partial [Paenarthrobacter sp.]
MPTDQSNTVSPDGARNATGTQVLAGPTPAATNATDAVKNATKKTKLRPKRRLKESDVNVVNKPMLRKALGGTIVGNTMEWYDVGVFGYLITTMGPV